MTEPKNRREAMQAISLAETLVLDDGKTKVKVVYNSEVAKQSFKFHKELCFMRGVKNQGDVSVYLPDFRRILEEIGIDPKQIERGDQEFVEDLLQQYADHHMQLRRTAYVEAMMIAALGDLFSLQRKGKRDVLHLKKGVKIEVPDEYWERVPNEPRVPAPVRRVERSVAEQMCATISALTTDNPEFSKQLNSVIAGLRDEIDAIDDLFGEEVDSQEGDESSENGFQPE
jgi:hypothetical protein